MFQSNFFWENQKYCLDNFVITDNYQHFPRILYPALYPVHLLVIPMYICTSQSLFRHSYVVNEWLNRHCNVQIRADELVNGVVCPKTLVSTHFCYLTISVVHFRSRFRYRFWDFGQDFGRDFDLYSWISVANFDGDFLFALSLRATRVYPLLCCSCACSCCSCRHITQKRQISSNFTMQQNTAYFIEFHHAIYQSNDDFQKWFKSWF
jgi:hypothetical protein